MAAKADERQRRSRGRPIEFDREAAVHAALDRFWKRGFEAVSVSDLADAMSIQRSSFYNSFGDRETAFREALEAYREIAPDAALAQIEPGYPVKPVIRKVFREICRVRAADPGARGCLVVNSIGELVGVNKELGACVADAVRNGIRLYERLLRQAVDQGEIEKPRDIRAAARAFVAFVSGLNTISKVVRDEGDLWSMSESFLERFGLGGRRRSRRARARG